MGLYLINISVDSADPNPNYIPEDLSINDQESLVEIFIEKVLGYDNAIEEYDDIDADEHNSQSNVKIDLLNQVCNTNKFANCENYKRKIRYTYYTLNLVQGFIEIDSPPPKA